MKFIDLPFYCINIAEQLLWVKQNSCGVNKKVFFLLQQKQTLSVLSNSYETLIRLILPEGI
ncbi:MAG: hypothetical protein ABIN13_02045, partial [Mucilaginibacter sp.]